MTTSPDVASARLRRRAALLALAGLGCLGLAAIALAVAGGLSSPDGSSAIGADDQGAREGAATDPARARDAGPAGPLSPTLAARSVGSVPAPAAATQVSSELAAADPGAATLPGVSPRARDLASLGEDAARLAAAEELEELGFTAMAEEGYRDLVFGAGGVPENQPVTDGGSMGVYGQASVADPAARSIDTAKRAATDPATRLAAAVGLARLALAHGDAAAARGALGPAAGVPADLDQLSPAGVYLQGVALEKLGDGAGAIAAFRRFAAVSPEMAGTAQMAIGQAAFAAGDHALAAEAFTKARDESATPGGQFLGALRRGNALLRLNLNEGRAAYEDAYRRANNDADRSQALAGQIAAARDEAEALRLRRRLVAELPATSPAASALAKLTAAGETVAVDQVASVKAGQGDVWGALTLLDGAVKADSKAPSAWRWQIIKWYASVRQRDQVVIEADSFLADLADDPLAAEVSWERARALAALGRSAEAVAGFASLAERWPEDARASAALWQRAWLVEEMDGLLPAAEAFDALARRYPQAREGADSRFRAALNYWRAGRLPKAAELWTASLDGPADAADKARAAYWLGRSALDGVDQGASPLAERHFQAALATLSGSFYAARAGDRLGISSAPPGTSQDASGSPRGWEAEMGDAASWDRIAAWLATWTGQTPEATAAALARVQSAPGLKRAATWLAIGDPDAARQAIAVERARLGNDSAALAALGLAAMRLGLVDAGVSAADTVWSRAPQSARQGAPAVFLRLVYPTPWAEWVVPVAAAHHVSPALFYGLIRQESRFLPSARSSAGASGLTQVMPGTGAHIANQLGLPFGVISLHRPYYALELGAWYLAEQLDRFAAPQPWPALSAYNGGPGNAKRWLKTAGDDLDLFVEIIDIGETRTYVKRIAEHEAMYKALYDWR